jgi:flavin-dependent dehydrogenase
MQNPGKDGMIQRSDRIPQMLGSLSRFKSMALLHQGYIERFFLDDIKEHSNGILHVERATLPESLHIAEDRCDDHSAENYPITVQLRYLADQDAASTEGNGSTVSNGLLRSNLTDDDTEELIAKSRERQGGMERVRAKYVVGCDGAHSWTRRQLGFGLEGESTDSIWGVLGELVELTFGWATTDYNRHYTNYRFPRRSQCVHHPQRSVGVVDDYPS